MLFNSFAFAVFLPIVFIVYWALPHKFRWILLLIASYYFYMSWNAKYVFLILFTTLVSYLAAIALEKAGNKKTKKWILAGAAIICLGLLFFFKYFNFFTASAAAVFEMFSIKLSPLTLKVLLPVGISFYTFQTLSYVIDVYRGDIPAEHHLGIYATFVSFFPQLVAGPIERAGNLLPQIRAEHRFDYEQATYGLKIMAWGFFKKIVVADMLILYISKVYSFPQGYHGFALVIAAAIFPFQIYCDFSGYSDIAIGAAKLMGIDLMANFKSPYFSQSIREYWSRWHISLSAWFRDYVYIPLGGNRVGKAHHCFNLLVTFLASGLWHGANWTYVIWGGLHGIAQVFETFFIPKKYRQSTGIVRWLRIAGVYLFCVFAFIIFASNSIGASLYVLGHLFDNISSPIAYLYNGFVDIGMGKLALMEALVFIIILEVYDYLSLKRDVIMLLSRQKTIIRWTVYVCFMLMVIFFSQKGVATEFVYFQF